MLKETFSPPIRNGIIGARLGCSLKNYTNVNTRVCEFWQIYARTGCNFCGETREREISSDRILLWWP